MWFRKRRELTDNLAAFLAAAHSASDKLIEWMRIDAALIRHALKNGGDKELTVPTDELRILLAEQLAAILMANENLMVLRGKQHFFNIRPLYVPLNPEDYEECVAKVWGRIWPDCRYPRYDKLTPDQRYMCFGPGGSPRGDTQD